MKTEKQTTMSKNETGKKNFSGDKYKVCIEFSILKLCKALRGDIQSHHVIQAFCTVTHMFNMNYLKINIWLI